MDISILLLIHDVDDNQALITTTALKQLLSILASIENIEIIVVDNGSPYPNAIRAISGTCQSRLTISRIETNVGIVAGYNHAASLAQGNLMMICHSDCVVLQETITGVYRCFSRNPDAGIVISKLYSPEGELLQSGGFISNSFHLAWYLDNPIDDIEVDWGDFITVRKNLFDMYGGLDRRYGLGYFEFPDLCLGIKSLNYRVILAADTKVIHYQSQTVNRVLGEARKQEIICANLKKFQSKWRHHQWLLTKSLLRSQLDESNLGILSVKGEPEAHANDFSSIPTDLAG